MARNDNNRMTQSREFSRIRNMNQELSELLHSENMALHGDDGARAAELLGIHQRYNNVIQQDYQGVRSSKNTGDNTYNYIARAITGQRDYKSSQDMFRRDGVKTGNNTQDKLLLNSQLDKLFTMGDTQIASYFLSTSSDVIHIYDEIDSVCAYFYQLEEANLITRDNVLRAEQVNEDISMNIEFPGITEDISSYVAIVKKALTYQNVSIKIRDHVAPKAIKYGIYYIMIIPYSEIGPKLLQLGQTSTMGYGGYPFYESTDTHALFEENADGKSPELDSCMESVTSIFEKSITVDNEILVSTNNFPTEVTEAINNIKENAKNILVSEDDSPVDIDGLGTHKNLNGSVVDAIKLAIDQANKKLTKEANQNKDNSTLGTMSAKMQVNAGERSQFCAPYDTSVEKIMSIMDDESIDIENLDKNDIIAKLAGKAVKKHESRSESNDSSAVMNTPYGITDRDLKTSEQMLGCHVKLVDPRGLVPVKIFDYVIGYYYFENYDYARLGTSITEIMSNQMNFNQRNMIIDNIVDSVLKNLKYGEILKGDNKLRSMILNCILYVEKRDNPIRIKFVRPEFVIPWKTNLDEHDNGQPVMLRSLLYARLYTSLILFYTTAIITKTTDSEFYYLKESALDGQMNNQISDMMDQLEDSNVDPIQIANGNLLHGNRAINKRYYLNMGTNEIKPFEMDVVSGQSIDIHNDFINDLKKMAIGATGVPAVMVDYVDEIEYATMLGMANIKHLTRCNGIKRDFNGPLTETAKALTRYCYPNSIPENVLDKLKITLRESKVINNNLTNQQLNDNVGLCETMVKTWLGGDNTQPPEIMAFVVEEMTKQLLIERTPSASWELLPDIYVNAVLKAKQNQLLNKVLTKKQEADASSGEEI